MKLKDLKEKLSKYPDDMEVIVSHLDGIEGEFAIFSSSIYHCNYTTKWQSEIDYYSLNEETWHYYCDEFEGKKQDVQIPMTKKDVLIIEV